jgi:hypothetical protein
MSNQAIRQALESHLADLASPLPTAWQGLPFTPPAGEPYQEVFLLPAANQTTDLRQSTTVCRGVFQVTLCYPTGSGVADAEAKADAIAAHFDPASTVLTKDGVTVRIEGRPNIGGPLPGEPGRLRIPVSVRYVSIN